MVTRLVRHLHDGVRMERKMEHRNFSTLATAVKFLESKTGVPWSPEMVVDRLQTLTSSHCDGFCLDTVFVLLVPCWRLEDTLTGEQVSFNEPVVARVCNAASFLGQIVAFDDVSIAVGRPLALVVGTRRFRTVAQIPASMLRLVPSDLRSLASMAGPDSVVPFLDLTVALRDGLFPTLSKELDEIAGLDVSVMALIARSKDMSNELEDSTTSPIGLVEQPDDLRRGAVGMAEAGPLPKPLPKLRHQEIEILRVLSELDYDPKGLPCNAPGKPGPKAKAREMLQLSKKQFDHAWERLLNNGDVVTVSN